MCLPDVPANGSVGFLCPISAAVSALSPPGEGLIRSVIRHGSGVQREVLSKPDAAFAYFCE